MLMSAMLVLKIPLFLVYDFFLQIYIQIHLQYIHKLANHDEISRNELLF
jgi:hypothetical protein